MITHVLTQRSPTGTGFPRIVHWDSANQRRKHVQQLLGTVEIEASLLFSPFPDAALWLGAQIERAIRITRQLLTFRQRLIQRVNKSLTQPLIIRSQILVQLLQFITLERHPSPPQLRHGRQRLALQEPRLVQIALSHPLVDRPIQLGQQLNVIGRVVQLAKG